MLSEEQLEKAMALSGEQLLVACIRKIKRGQLTIEEMKLLCEMWEQEHSPEEPESVAKDIGLI